MNYIAKLLLNSLYGRFGMNDDFTFIDIIDKRDYLNFTKDPEVKNNVVNVAELGDFYLIQSINRKRYLENEAKAHDVNIAVAAGVTANARMVMIKVNGLEMLLAKQW